MDILQENLSRHQHLEHGYVWKHVLKLHNVCNIVLQRVCDIVRLCV